MIPSVNCLQFLVVISNKLPQILKDCDTPLIKYKNKIGYLYCAITNKHIQESGFSNSDNYKMNINYIIL